MTSTTTPASLRRHGGAVESRRDVLRVEGADATSFLQGQLSQDVESLAIGGSAWSLLLHPQGHIAAWIRLHRIDENSFVVDVDAGFGEAVKARLDRFKLRVDCTIEPVDWSAVSVRGPAVAAIRPDAASIVAAAEWPGVEGVDLLGPDVVVPEGISVLGPEELETLRIEAGVPAMGAELSDDTIPAATGIVDRSASFTKGCYTGQELVARMDSRGNNTPQRLHGVVASSDYAGLLTAGAALRQGEKEVGHLTSVARSDDLGSMVALAYLHRSAEVPGGVQVQTTAGDWVDAEARTLPLVS